MKKSHCWLWNIIWRIFDASKNTFSSMFHSVHGNLWKTFQRMEVILFAEANFSIEKVHEFAIASIKQPKCFLFAFLYNILKEYLTRIFKISLRKNRMILIMKPSRNDLCMFWITNIKRSNLIHKTARISTIFELVKNLI